MIIAYCRKSTEGDSEQERSIPAQKKAIEDFAVKNSLGKVEKWFEEAHSASGRGEDRKIFLEMIKFCETNKNGKLKEPQ